MCPQHLVIFARQPLLGKTKSRLAADIGAIAAHKFYRKTLNRTAWNLGRDHRWKTWLSLPESNWDQPNLQNGKFAIHSHIVIYLLESRVKWFNHIETIAKVAAL